MDGKLIEWLAKLGLSKYAEVFVQSEISFSNIQNLTESDLREMEIPIGPRKTILESIHDTQDLTNHEQDSDDNANKIDRRYLTILFCDLVGSTSLSQQLDPEDLRKLLQEYQNHCTRVIGEYEGYIARFLGDGILIYFGYPKAQEDASIRAVRTALDIVKTVAEIDVLPKFKLQVRIGIDSGVVVVGDIVGTGNSQEHTVIGEAPNRAARLQSLAPVNGVVISEQVKSQLRELAEYKSMGVHELKGFATKQEIWLVDRYTPRSSRNSVSRYSSPLVGRNDQLIYLKSFLADGSASIKATDIVGEPGVGKSRLLHEIVSKCGAWNLTMVYGECTIDGTQTPFSAISSVLRDAFNLTDKKNTTPDQLGIVLENLGLHSQINVDILSRLFSIAPKYNTLDGIDGLQVGILTRKIITDILLSLSPLAVLLEDVHWIDASTDDLLSNIISSNKEVCLRIITSKRPGFTPKWSDSKNVETLSVEPLCGNECEELIRSLSNDTIDSELVKNIANRSGGNALFAEELVNYFSTGFQQDRVVPESISILLSSRIDCLGEGGREVLQIASAIGRDFKHDLLSKIITHISHVKDILLQGVQMELLYEVGPDHLRFKHALVQDTLYDSMLRERKEEIHLSIAKTIEQEHTENLSEHAEPLAYHYSRSSDQDRAIHYLVLSGSEALDKYALEEAAQRHREAFNLLEKSNTNAESLKVKLLKQHTHLLNQKLELTTIADIFRKSEDFLFSAENSEDLVVCLCNITWGAVFSREYQIACIASEKALDIAKKIQSPSAQAYAQAGYVLAQMHSKHTMHSYQDLEEKGRSAVLLSKDTNDSYLQYFANIGVGWLQITHGYTDRSKEFIDTLLVGSEEERDPRVIALTSLAKGWGNILDEEWESALACGKVAVETAVTEFDRSIGEQVVGFSLTALGKPEEGLRILDEHFRSAAISGFHYARVGAPGGRAGALALTGNIGSARRYLFQETLESERIDDIFGCMLKRLMSAELIIEILLSKETPRLSVVVRNFFSIVRLKTTGVKDAHQELQMALEIPLFEKDGPMKRRVQANRAILFAIEGQPDAASECIELAKFGLNNIPKAIQIRITRAKELLNSG